MSVRPITYNEVSQAYGAPWSTWLAFFGASQGLMTHLRFHGTTMHQSWLPNGMAKLTLPVFVLGGAVVGVTLAHQMFGDAELRRLHRQHVQDQSLNIEGRKFDRNLVFGSTDAGLKSTIVYRDV